MPIITDPDKADPLGNKTYYLDLLVLPDKDPCLLHVHPNTHREFGCYHLTTIGLDLFNKIVDRDSRFGCPDFAGWETDLNQAKHTAKDIFS